MQCTVAGRFGMTLTGRIDHVALLVTAAFIIIDPLVEFEERASRSRTTLIIVIVIVVASRSLCDCRT